MEQCFDFLSSFDAVKSVLSLLDTARKGRLADISPQILKPLAGQQALVIHDHVYALIGLFDRKPMYHILPAYDQPVAQAYIDFTYKLMSQDNDINILAHCIGIMSNPLSLPSWVPDYSQTYRIRDIGSSFLKNMTRGGVKYRGDVGLQISSHGMLRVPGCILDDVVYAQPTLLDFGPVSGSRLEKDVAYAHSYHKLWRSVFELEEDNNSVYIGGGNLEDAYWNVTSSHESRRDPPWGETGRCWLTQNDLCILRNWYRLQAWQDDYTMDKETRRFLEQYHAKVGLIGPDYLFRTRKGYIGITNRSACPVPGDKLALIPTASQSFLLRLKEGHAGAYQMVSEVYVHGLQEVRKTDDPFEDIKAGHVHERLATEWKAIWLC